MRNEVEEIPTNLPQEQNSFVGRERELDKLQQLVGVTRALTLCGAGGIGKTRLALQMLAAVADEFPDGVWFAVVRGAESADVAYPPRGGLAQASDRTRREASRAIARLQPVGGTAIGRWLSMASELVALRPGAHGHALLLTDGKDEDETPIELRAALESCEGTSEYIFGIRR